MSSDSPAGRWHSTGATGVSCMVCKATGKTNQLLQCVNCSVSVHPACLHKQFKDANNEPLKNKIDWLSDFIKYASLVYRCKACTDKSKVVHQVATTEITNIAGQISDVKQSIEDLKNKMALFTASICSTKSDIGATALKPTYAQVLSSQDIAIAVETAITKSRKKEQQSTCVVMYGMYEYDNDWGDVADIFQLISCHARPLTLTRIGNATRSNARPLKIELSSLSDTKDVLSCANQLKWHDDTYHLRLSPWLSEDEMSKIRDTRRRCKLLNDKASADNGTTPFVVISGELKIRKDGKLVTYREPATASSSKSALEVNASNTSKPSSSNSSATKPLSPSDSSSHPKNA